MKFSTKLSILAFLVFILGILLLVISKDYCGYTRSVILTGSCSLVATSVVLIRASSAYKEVNK